ncbi:MAG TPA: hypothetical protein VL096_01995 [Pirellulaceae bacterium]|nr:hypothetical protein [Pirellulaceae bacterium]
MSIEFHCPQCARKFSVAPSQAGQRAKCGGCQAVIEVPKESAPKLAASQVDGDKIRVTCACGRAFRTAPSAIGKVGACDQCGAKFTIAPPTATPAADLDDLISEGIAQAAVAREIPIERPPDPLAATQRKNGNPLLQALRTDIAFNSWGVAIAVGVLVFLFLAFRSWYAFQNEQYALVQGWQIGFAALQFGATPMLICLLLKLDKWVKVVTVVVTPFIVLGLGLMGKGLLTVVE